MKNYVPQSAPHQNGLCENFAGSAQSTCTSHPSRRSIITRLIHFILLLLVIHQLIGSEFMEFPFPGDPPSWAFSLHQNAGLASLVPIAAFWIWTVARHGETRLGQLLPWFSMARFHDVMSDLTKQLYRVARGRAPDDVDGSLASAIHGLGLLVATAMTVTGAIFIFTHGTSVGHVVLDLHKLIAKLMWAYLLGHASLAVLHHLLGSDILSRMLWPISFGRGIIRSRWLR